MLRPFYAQVSFHGLRHTGNVLGWQFHGRYYTGGVRAVHDPRVCWRQNGPKRCCYRRALSNPTEQTEALLVSQQE